MSKLGKLDAFNLNLGMGLSINPGQKLDAKYASLDGFEMPDSKTLFNIVIGAAILYFLFCPHSGK